MNGASLNFAALLALSFAKSEAPAYAQAGCTDLMRIQELQWAGITPEHMLACGRSLGEAYSEGVISLTELLSVLMPEGKSLLSVG
ncbi:MAG: hypothetical protein ACO1TE_02270 [Prosthecobacter sp.]